jgi:hypothetical protein
VGPRTFLDDVEKRKFLALPGLELEPLGHPARSESLLLYLGSVKCILYISYAVVIISVQHCKTGIHGLYRGAFNSEDNNSRLTLFYIFSSRS